MQTRQTTKELIAASFMELAEKKPIDKITVREVAANCAVSTVTFYNHFRDKYDNYDAINVDKVSDIPCDYWGVMGVPITFLDKYNPDQFEIVAFRKGNDGKDLVYSFTEHNFASEASKIIADSGSSDRISEYSSGENARRCNPSDSERQECVQADLYPSATAIAGMIKNAEGKINGKITYARITIRRRKYA